MKKKILAAYRGDSKKPKYLILDNSECNADNIDDLYGPFKWLRHTLDKAGKIVKSKAIKEFNYNLYTKENVKS